MTMTNNLKTLTIVLMAGLLSACMTSPPTNQVYDSGPAIELAEAAGSINQSMNSLQENNQAANPPQEISALPPAATYGMQMPISIDWNGPIGPLVTKITQIANYHLTIIGNEPAVPVIVSIHARNTSLAEVLRNAGYQAGNRANIVVYPSTKVVDLRYNSNDDM
jgi:defect-in-organelle-trafficking protein DotD